MNILYYGMSGSAANPNLGWALIIIGAIVTIALAVIIAVSGISENWLVATIIPIVCVIIGAMNLVDSRAPYVKATISDDALFKDVITDYEFIIQEGDLYTFKPKNVDIDEWEQRIKSSEQDAIVQE